MPIETPSTCPDCGGDGWINGEFCTTCMGGGSVPVTGINRYLKETYEDLRDKINDVTDKCNDIKIVVDEIKVVVDAL